jgi:hypothetical protein
MWPVHVADIAEDMSTYTNLVFKTLNEETLGRPKPDGNATLNLASLNAALSII